MGIDYHLFSGDDTLSTNQMDSIFEDVKSAVSEIRARRKRKERPEVSLQTKKFQKENSVGKQRVTMIIPKSLG